MSSLFLIRLALDLTAASLLLAAFAYNGLGNLAHEIIGTVMFLLLISHNIFNRRWYGTLAKRPHDARGLITKTINLSLLVTVLALLVTSGIISQAVFSFLPVTSTSTARQIHTLVAHLALLIAAAHLGLHWTMIMSVARSRFGITTTSRRRTCILRAIALIISAYGVRSLFAANVGSKLLMQMTFGFESLQTAMGALLLDHAAIVGLGAFVAHYTLKITQVGRPKSSPLFRCKSTKPAPVRVSPRPEPGPN